MSSGSDSRMDPVGVAFGLLSVLLALFTVYYFVSLYLPLSASGALRAEYGSHSFHLMPTPVKEGLVDFAICAFFTYCFARIWWVRHQ